MFLQVFSEIGIIITHGNHPFCFENMTGYEKYNAETVRSHSTSGSKKSLRLMGHCSRSGYHDMMKQASHIEEINR